MKRECYLAILLSLLLCSTAFGAPVSQTRDGKYSSSYDAAVQQRDQLTQAEDLVTLSLYILDANSEDQEAISGVDAYVRDAAGNIFEGTTDENGAILFRGVPGTWTLALAKDGYRSAGLVYNVTESQVAAAFIRQEDEAASGARTEATGVPSQGSIPSQGSLAQGEANMQSSYEKPLQVALTVDVHQDSVNGAPLAGVHITGLDAAGNGFEAFTNSTGSAVISGVPGTWQFDFAKDGYGSLILNYNMTETHEAAAYLSAAEPATASPAPMQSQSGSESLANEVEPVVLTVDVHQDSVNGAPLAGVQIAGLDAAGNAFEAATNSTGKAVISGVPGTWQFEFAKDGYESASLNYNVTETHEAAAYLQATAKSNPTQMQSRDPGSEVEMVELTVDVNKGSINGSPLAGVQITGLDAAGNAFEAATNSTGKAVISGVPGTWQFEFARDGYGSLNLAYNVTETHEAAAYLELSDQ
ncbi:MAG: hypothetical protein EHM14_12220 [Methanothrix sp.]|nr:MAG: hypothetical protein EHM14_12220 [Methanothrix sp.]